MTSISPPQLNLNIFPFILKIIFIIIKKIYVKAKVLEYITGQDDAIKRYRFNRI